MTQNNEREAFEAKINSFNRGQKLNLTPHHDSRFGTYLSDHTECAFRAFKSVSQNEHQEAVEALRERDKLGYAVVGVIGKLDEIIDVAEDVEFNDFAHIAIPLELWNELKDALELMPERADNFTSPPKQIPDGWKPSEKEILKYASEEELFLFADESDLLGIANGILELVQIKINASTTSLTSDTNTEVGE